MKLEFRGSFAKDLKSVRDKALLKRVKELIEEVERAESLTEISNLKKLKGAAITIEFALGTTASAWRWMVTRSSLFASSIAKTSIGTSRNLYVMCMETMPGNAGPLPLASRKHLS